MAVALNGSVFSGQGNVTNATFTLANVVVPSGANQILIVGVAYQAGTTGLNTAVTWNGISLTQYAEYNANPNGNDDVVVWYLLNPTPGTANVVVTMGNDTNQRQGVIAYTLSGVNQATPFGGNFTKHTLGTGNPVSIAVTGAPGDLFIDFYNDDNQGGSLAQTPAAGQTTTAVQLCFNNNVLMGSYKAGAASTTLGWTLHTNPEGAWIVVDVQQAPTGSGGQVGNSGPGISPNAQAQFKSQLGGGQIIALLASGASAVATGTAALLASALMSAPAQAIATATVSLTTGAPITVPAFAVATATSSLSTVITAAETASEIATATGSLSATILFASTGSAVATAVVDLHTAVGPGSGFVPQPGPGIGPFSNNQFQSFQRGLTNPSAALAAGATMVPTATAALSTGVSLAATAFAVATSTANITPWAATASAVETATVALTTAIPLVGTALEIPTATAALTTGISITAPAGAVATATDSLSTGINLVGTAGEIATSTALLQTGEVVIDTAFAVATATATLNTGVSLSAIASAVATSTATIFPNFAQMAGTAAAVATSTGALSATIVPSAAASAIPTATALLQTAAGFIASGQAIPTATAQLTSQESMVAAGSAVMTAKVTALTTPTVVTQAPRLLLRTQRPLGWPQAVFGAMDPFFEIFMRGAGGGASGDVLLWGIDWTRWLEQGWQSDIAIALNNCIRPTYENGFEYLCTTAGQTGTSEPTWPAFSGAVVNDGSVVWTAQPASNASLGTTLQNATWFGTSPVVVTSASFFGQISAALIDTTAALQGTDYMVYCNATFGDGSRKTAEIRVRVR